MANSSKRKPDPRISFVTPLNQGGAIWHSALMNAKNAQLQTCLAIGRVPYRQPSTAIEPFGQGSNHRSQLTDDLLQVHHRAIIKACLDAIYQLRVHGVSVLSRSLVDASTQILRHTNVKPLTFRCRHLLLRLSNLFHARQDTKAKSWRKCPHNWGHSTGHIDESARA